MQPVHGHSHLCWIEIAWIVGAGVLSEKLKAALVSSFPCPAGLGTVRPVPVATSAASSPG